MTLWDAGAAYLLAVLLDPLDVLLVALGVLFLLDRRDNPPRCATRADDVLVRHAQQIPLLHLEQLRAMCNADLDLESGGNSEAESTRITLMLTFASKYSR